MRCAYFTLLQQQRMQLKKVILNPTTNIDFTLSVFCRVYYHFDYLKLIEALIFVNFL